jgi:progressive ankylosis protein
MMATEGPFLAAVIARLAEPKYNLAAYGVAFSFALIVESPIIMMMSASTALVKDRGTYRRLRNFTVTLNAGITAVMLVFLLPPVFFFVAETLIGLPSPVATLAYWTTAALLPWPAAIGFRRFYQGVLISRRLTRRVAYGTVIRIVSMAATAVGLVALTTLPGAVVGGLSLSMAVCVEAVVSRFMTAASIAELLGTADGPDIARFTTGFITRFYYPLALTSLLALGVQPLITLFIGRSNHALESLAVLPVINSLVFVFRSFGLSLQEVTIAHLGDGREGYHVLRRFATMVGAVALAGLTLIGFTPLSALWFQNVSGLTPELASFALAPIMIQAVIPAASVLLAFQHAVLVHAKVTMPITLGTAIEVSGIVLVMAGLVFFTGVTGAVAASIALVAGRAAANAYLFVPFARVTREQR